MYTFIVRAIYALLKHRVSAANVPEHWQTLLRNRILIDRSGSPFKVYSYSVSVQIQITSLLAVT